MTSKVAATSMPHRCWHHYPCLWQDCCRVRAPGLHNSIHAFLSADEHPVPAKCRPRRLDGGASPAPLDCSLRRRRACRSAEHHRHHDRRPRVGGHGLQWQPRGEDAAYRPSGGVGYPLRQRLRHRAAMRPFARGNHPRAAPAAIRARMPGRREILRDLPPAGGCFHPA